MSEMNIELYNRALKLIRQYHRLSQVELSRKVGLSKSFISELEKGHKRASIDVLNRYAAFFNMPLSSLLLFAERAETGGVAERSRVFVATKVLKMLEWIEQTTTESASQ